MPHLLIRTLLNLTAAIIAVLSPQHSNVHHIHSTAGEGVAVEVKVVELDLLLLILLVLCRADLYPPCSLALLFIPHYPTPSPNPDRGFIHP